MFLFPILFAVLASCTKGALPVKRSNSGAEVVNSSVNKTLLVNLVNTAREKGCQCGDTYFPPAPPVAWNDLLEKAAAAHSKDMLVNKYFSHTGPDGANAGIRLERVGYPWKTYGENIASGYASEQTVVEDWLKSPSHCKNIMNKSYREMGVARAGNIWTQKFGTR